jgi:hypothetical protein
MIAAYENDVPVQTVDFEYPDEGDAEPTVTTDRWMMIWE